CKPKENEPGKKGTHWRGLVSTRNGLEWRQNEWWLELLGVLRQKKGGEKECQAEGKERRKEKKKKKKKGKKKEKKKKTGKKKKRKEETGGREKIKRKIRFFIIFYDYLIIYLINLINNNNNIIIIKNFGYYMGFARFQSSKKFLATKIHFEVTYVLPTT